MRADFPWSGESASLFFASSLLQDTEHCLSATMNPATNSYLMNYMALKFLGLLFCCLIAGGVSAQDDRQPIFQHALSEKPSEQPRRLSSTFSTSTPETLRILVTMIAFQEDTDPRTSGTGSFDTSQPKRKSIDQSPHDLAYVQNHFTFVQNYFRKSSRDKLVVLPTVLDSVYRLPRKMQEYSPPRSSTTNAELGLLVNDAWRTVDSLTPGFPFQQYQSFVIFHAGAGRDIDLTSLYGYDPTPFDIPSVYMNLPGLRNIHGSGYNGVPVSGGSFFVSNSIIVPESENREIPTVSGTALLQLGINGLLVASVGSHLGLPDLFNTKTGRSGIGRFGLMDGQSIFSWGGVFPPEPSAWEKQFLGWSDPLTVTPGETSVLLPAVSLSDSILRVPINAKEYFLVENRNRDANRDGATVTMVRNGVTVQRTWARDTSAGFNAFNQDSLYGVVTDVDEFDFSLPGGVNTRTGEYFDGGILIWHIDENVIDVTYGSNAVNANPDRRGVDLEEADGSQDIGQSYGFISAGAGTEDGVPVDFWYAGNSSTLRQISNQFTPASQPNSMSNDGGNSHVYVKNFGVRGPRMQITVRVGDEQITPLTGFPKSVPFRVKNNSLAVVDRSGGLLIATDTLSADNSAGPNSYQRQQHGPSRLFGWNYDGSPLLPNGHSSGFIVSASSQCTGSFHGKAITGDLDDSGSIDVLIGENGCTAGGTFTGGSMRAWALTDVNNDQLADSLFASPGNLSGFTTSTVLSDSFIAAGTKAGAIQFLRRNGERVSEISYFADDNNVVGLSLWDKSGVYLEVRKSGIVAALTPYGVLDAHQVSAEFSSSAAIALLSTSFGKCAAVASTDGRVYLLDDSLEVLLGFPLATGGEILNSPAIADIDGDGQKDIIVFSGNRIYAINAAGAILNNFPVTVSTKKTILTSPIVADVDGNGTNDIVAVTQEGLVAAYSKTGKLVPGFPLLAGTNGGSTPAVFYLPSPCLSCIDIGLAVASDDGNVYAWRTGSLGVGSGIPPTQPWPQYMHDARNSGLDDSAPGIVAGCLSCPVLSNAYNWPNPVRAEDGFKTHLRYYLTADATVTIKILDLAGDLVTELRGRGLANFDNEIEWDVTNIQSGIYFAHLEAEGGGSAAIVKIAVVK